MKINKEKIIRIIEIIINACLLPLFNIKFFHEVAILPGKTETGEFVAQEFHYYYSLIDNFKYDPFCLIYISIGLIIMSIITSLISLVIKDNHVKIAAHAISVSSIVFFSLIFFIASLIRRHY